LPKRTEIDAQAKSFYETLNPIIEPAINRTAVKKTKTAKIIVAENKDAGEEADKLSRLLVVEKLANLSAKRLVIVADGALNLIPFASLKISEHFIAEKFETVQLPSLTTLHVLREANIKPFAPNSLAIIADPVFSGNDERLAKNYRLKNKNVTANSDLTATLRDFNLTTLSRLPFTRIEAEKISQNSTNKTTLNLDFKANRERLLNGEFDRFDILHFATHGFLNNQHPELSGLVLSLTDEKGNQQNGFLRTQDLYLLKIKPQMVVLSACQTGLGKQVENEGLIGLTRGFLAIGTPRIIATLWKVDDAATAEFMSRFYRAMLKENQVPSAALKTAQNEMRRISRFNNPRYWAGFVLTGEWR
jgi:CHAT domain-containing protein